MGAFSDGEHCIVSLELNGVEYTGEAKWTSDEGFEADLEGYFEGSYARPDQMPELLPIEIGKGKRAIIVKPALTGFGGMKMAIGRPLVTGIKIRADAVVHGLPWDIPGDLRLQKIGVECEALRLWYGDDTAKVDTDRESQETTATFRTSEEEHQTSAGTLKINLGYSAPGWPSHGKYNFRTSTTAYLILDKPVKLKQVTAWAERIENFFDIFSAFLPSDKRVRIWLADHDNVLDVSFRNHLREGGTDNHPFNSFLRRSDGIDIPAAFDAYLTQYDDLQLLQSTTRYLSSNTMRVPEGFLTACNLVEALGVDDAVANQERLDAAAHIAELVKKNPEYEKSWKTIDRSLLKQPSFKARYDVVAEKAGTFGCPVSLRAGKVRDVRAKYRHDLRKLDHDDLNIMRAFVGLAWTMGLVELCDKIGIGKDLLSQALSNESFHMNRGTNVHSWSSKFAETRSAKSNTEL